MTLDQFACAGNLKSLTRLSDHARRVFVQGDPGDRDLVDRFLVQHRPRAVFNFAAEIHVDCSIHGPEDSIKANSVGTFRLLETARAYWSALLEAEKKAFRFLHVSTDEVHGNLTMDGPSFAETNRVEPTSPYSA